MRGSRHTTLDGILEGRAELIAEGISARLEAFHGQSIELGLHRLKAPLHGGMLGLEEGDDLGHIAAVALIDAPFQEATETAQADPGEEGPGGREGGAVPGPAIPIGLRLDGLEALGDDGAVVVLAVGAGGHEVVVVVEHELAVVVVVALPSDSATGDGGKERPAQLVGADLVHDLGPEVVHQVGRRAELGDLGVELGVDDDGAGEVGIGLLHDLPGGAVLPVHSILDAQDDVVGAAHLGNNEALGLPGRGRQGPLLGVGLAGVAAAGDLGSGDEAGRVDEDHVGAVLVLHPDVDLPGIEGADGVALEAVVLGLDVLLDLLQGLGPLDAVVALEEAPWRRAAGVVLHPQGDGAARLGAAADLIELEAHEGLDEGRLAAGLMADYHDGRCVEGLFKVLVCRSKKKEDTMSIEEMRDEIRTMYAESQVCGVGTCVKACCPSNVKAYDARHGTKQHGTWRDVTACDSPNSRIGKTGTKQSIATHLRQRVEHVVGIVQGTLLAALAVLGVVAVHGSVAVVVAVAAPSEHPGHPSAHGVLLAFHLLVEVEKGRLRVIVPAGTDLRLYLLVALGRRHGRRDGGFPPLGPGRRRRCRRRCCCPRP
jgi:hypothetical protein